MREEEATRRTGKKLPVDSQPKKDQAMPPIQHPAFKFPANDISEDNLLNITVVLARATGRFLAQRDFAVWVEATAVPANDNLSTNKD